MTCVAKHCAPRDADDGGTGAVANQTVAAAVDPDDPLLNQLTYAVVAVCVLRLLDYVAPALRCFRSGFLAGFLSHNSEERLLETTEPEAPEPEPEPEAAVGQVVWVRDSYSNKVPWNRGVVEGHDPGSGKPLVRAVAGRLKTWKMNNHARVLNNQMTLTCWSMVWRRARRHGPGSTS